MVNKPNGSNSSYDLPTSFANIYPKTRFTAQQLSDGYDINNAGSLGNAPFGDHVNWQYDITFRWLKYLEGKTDQLPQPTGIGDATKIPQINGSGTAFELKSTSDIRTSINAPDIINSNITLNVPSNYADINLALASLEGRLITNNAYAIIQVADGNYNYTSEIKVKHPNGDRIKILGNITTPSNCVLNFPINVSGIVVGDGNVLGLLNGFKIKGVDDITTVGISAYGSSVIRTGDKIIVEDFGYNVVASYNSYIYCVGILSQSASGSGMSAQMGSTIYADNAISQNNTLDGFNAWHGGTILARYATSQSNGVMGFLAVNFGNIDASNASAVSNGSDGFNSDLQSYIKATNTFSTNNVVYGYYASANSFNYVLGSVPSGNAINYNPALGVEGALGGWNLI